MRNITKLFAAAILAALIASPVAAQRVVVNSGHVGSVRSIEISGDGEYLITAGDDGTVRELDIDNGKLRRSIQASAFPITDLAVHPRLPRVAIVESDSVSLYSLSVWDLEKGESLYSVQLEERPLDLSFSPKGTYLFYTRSDWNSVVMLDAERGVPIRKRGSTVEQRFSGFGIVGAFMVSSSENTFLAYLPSGSLQYRDMATGELKPQTTRIATRGNLTGLRFLSDGFTAIGWSGNELVAINIVSGAGTSVSPGAIRDIAVDRDSGEVLVLHEGGSQGLTLSLYAYQTDQFISRYSLYNLPADGVVAMMMDNRTVFTGLASGEIYRQTRSQIEPVVFSRRLITDVQDILPGDSSIITTADTIFTVNFESFADGSSRMLVFDQLNPLVAETAEEPADPEPLEPAFDPAAESSLGADDQIDLAGEEETPEAPEATDTRKAKNVTVGATGVRRLANDLYILYDRGGTSGRMIYFSPVTGLLQQFDPVSLPPITSLDIRGFDLLTVNATGSLRISNLFSSSESFAYDSFGLRTAIFIEDPYIVTAGQRSGVPRTTMLRINTVTHETVPLSNQNTVTFSLAYDSASGALYSASIDRSTSPAKTVIMKHSGKNLEVAETVFAAEGEFNDASVAARRGTVFFTVGTGTYLKRSDESKFGEIEPSNAIPKSVAIYGDWLYSVNRDSSISLWGIDSGKLLASFYLLGEYGWAAIAGDGNLIASARGAAKAFAIYE